MTDKEKMELMNLRNRCRVQREEIKRLQEIIKQLQKTNADRIRSMSDEKLAEWLGDMLGVYPFGTEQWDRQAWLDWLKKEVE